MLRQVSNSGLAVEAIDLVKDFGDTRAVDGVTNSNGGSASWAV